jgi:hypothetical protein
VVCDCNKNLSGKGHRMTDDTLGLTFESRRRLKDSNACSFNLSERLSGKVGSLEQRPEIKLFLKV